MAIWSSDPRRLSSGSCRNQRPTRRCIRWGRMCKNPPWLLYWFSLKLAKEKKTILKLRRLNQRKYFNPELNQLATTTWSKSVRNIPTTNIWTCGQVIYGRKRQTGQSKLTVIDDRWLSWWRFQSAQSKNRLELERVGVGLARSCRNPQLGSRGNSSRSSVYFYVRTSKPFFALCFIDATAHLSLSVSSVSDLPTNQPAR